MPNSPTLERNCVRALASTGTAASHDENRERVMRAIYPHVDPAELLGGKYSRTLYWVEVYLARAEGLNPNGTFRMPDGAIVTLMAISYTGGLTELTPSCSCRTFCGRPPVFVLKLPFAGTSCEHLHPFK